MHLLEVLGHSKTSLTGVSDCQKKLKCFFLGAGVVAAGAGLSTVALAAANFVGEGLDAQQTPAGFATPGGCTKREARVSFCAV